MISQRATYGLTEADAYVLDGVVCIDAQVTVCGQSQVKQAMSRKKREEMIERADSRLNRTQPGAIDREFEVNPRLSGDAPDNCSTLRHVRR
jgi:hypothetical protein